MRLIFCALKFQCVRTKEMGFRCCAVAPFLFLLAVVASPAIAQQWPTKNVKVLVPQTPAGTKPEHFLKIMRADIPRYLKLAKNANIIPE